MYQVTELTPRDALMYLLEEEGDHRGWERQALVDSASLLLAPLGSTNEVIAGSIMSLVKELASMAAKGLLRVTPDGFLCRRTAIL